MTNKFNFEQFSELLDVEAVMLEYHHDDQPVFYFGTPEQLANHIVFTISNDDSSDEELTGRISFSSESEELDVCESEEHLIVYSPNPVGENGIEYEDYLWILSAEVRDEVYKAINQVNPRQLLGHGAKDILHRLKTPENLPVFVYGDDFEEIWIGNPEDIRRELSSLPVDTRVIYPTQPISIQKRTHIPRNRPQIIKEKPRTPSKPVSKDTFNPRDNVSRPHNLRDNVSRPHNLRDSDRRPPNMRDSDRRPPNMRDSDRRAHNTPKVGGWTAWRPVNSVVMDIIDQFQEAIEAKLDQKFLVFTPVRMKSQVVAGIKYLVEVRTHDAVIMVNLFRDLEGNYYLGTVSYI